MREKAQSGASVGRTALWPVHVSAARTAALATSPLVEHLMHIANEWVLHKWCGDVIYVQRKGMHFAAVQRQVGGRSEQDEHAPGRPFELVD